jgi:DNA (cytosine-5)-methyltransferase 1
MRFLSLFAGVGGFDLGLERAGHVCVGQVENDPACQRVLKRRFPDAPRWSDVQYFRADDPDAPPDLLVGGFPCQDVSIAGRQAGLGGARSSLFWEFVRVQKEVNAPWALLENVPGLRSVGLGRDFQACVAALAELWPAVGWRTLDSRFFNIAQRRERVFLVCGPSDRGVSEVLFETENGRGDLEAGETPEQGDPSRRAGSAQVAGTLGGSSQSGGFRTTDLDNHGALIVSGTLGTAFDRGNDIDGHGAFVRVESFAENQRAEIRMANVAPQLTGGGGKAGQGYPVALVGSRVRRLTPTECERLQGFPDGWTDVPGSSDSTRYRQLGNAVTVNVARWLGERLREVAK